MQLQLNDHIAFELVPCTPLRDTGYKREDTKWSWAKVVGVTTPVKMKGDKSCFAAKIPAGKYELVGVSSEASGSSYRSLKTPVILYVLMDTTPMGRVIVAIRAYRNVQLDPINGDCGDLVFDTLEMSDDTKYSHEALARLELYYYRTRSELESWVRKIYHKRGQQLAFVTHDHWRKLLIAKIEAERAGFVVTQDAIFNEEISPCDGESGYKIGSVDITTDVQSSMSGFELAKVSNRSMIGGVLYDVDGQLLAPRPTC